MLFITNVFSIKPFHQHCSGHPCNKGKTHNYPVVIRSSGGYPESLGGKSIVQQKVNELHICVYRPNCTTVVKLFEEYPETTSIFYILLFVTWKIPGCIWITYLSINLALNVIYEFPFMIPRSHQQFQSLTTERYHTLRLLNSGTLHERQI